MEPSVPYGEVRRCLYRDLDRILPIYNLYISRSIASLDAHVQTSASLQTLYNFILDQDLPFVVATGDENHKHDILGFAYACNFRQLPVFGGTVEIFIYVDPTATGRGIGKKMLALLTELLRLVPVSTDRERGVREMLAIVPVEKGRDASDFFLQQNFEDIGSLHRVGRKMGRWVDVRYFQRSLNEVPRDPEVQTERAPVRHWWSSLFRRRRRRRQARRMLREYHEHIRLIPNG